MHTLNEQNKEFVVYFWLSSFIHAYLHYKWSGNSEAQFLTDSLFLLGQM